MGADKMQQINRVVEIICLIYMADRTLNHLRSIVIKSEDKFSSTAVT